MKKIDNYLRARNLMLEAIKLLNLDLTGMRVLTEAGSGSFIVTPIIAALAGAQKVYVVVKDSSYGKKEEIKDYVEEMIRFTNISPDKICPTESPSEIAHNVNVVTNLGFVRPITRELICKLPYDAAIPLMYETWEMRKEDIDYKSCLEFDVPILGTKETDERLCIFRYVGMTALKLLMEQGVEVFKSKVLLISSGEYLVEIGRVLRSNGAELYIYNPYEKHPNREALENFTKECDAIVIAEQKNKESLISDNHIPIDWINASLTRLVHIAGVIEYSLLENKNIIRHPKKQVSHGYMTVTTDYIGVRPVIELHTAGLKVGQALVEGKRKYHNAIDAKRYALENSPAMDF